MEIEDKHIPVRKPRIGTGDQKTPIDKRVREIIRKKHTLARKAPRTENPDDRAQYNRHRNIVKNEMNKIKRGHEKDLSKKARSNPKAIWQYIKSKSKTRIGIGDLRTETSDPKSGKTDKGSELTGDIPKFEDRLVVSNMRDLFIERKDIEKVLGRIKVDKSPGLDKVHPRV